MVEYVPNAVAFILSFCFWWATYWAGWYVFPRWDRTRARWKTMSESQQYLLCATIQSTLHGIMIPIGIIASLSHCQIWGDFTAHDCSAIGPVFACTVSYFAMDGILTVYYRADLWVVYLIHHIVGSLPFIINCFVCQNMQFLVGGGILIEIANPFLNMRMILELFNLKNSDLAADLTYATAVIWLFVRVAWPLYLLYGMMHSAIPSQGASDPCWGVIPTYVTGWAIAVFCTGVFLFVLLPDVFWYWRGEHRKVDAADAAATAQPGVEELEEVTTLMVNVEPELTRPALHGTM